MSTTKVHLAASILAAVVATSLFLAALMLGSNGVTNTLGHRTFECGSAWNVMTRPDNREPLTFVVLAPESRDYTYDGITGCDEAKGDRNRLAVGAAILGLLAAAAALVESRRYKTQRSGSGAPETGEVRPG